MNNQFWHNRKVLITGHSGFKGNWISHWLYRLNAKVYGYSLSEKNTTNLFDSSKKNKIFMSSIAGDIKNLNQLKKFIKYIKPEIIFHLAAQPIVKKSYLDPLETYTTNVIGTVNLFEACRECKSIKVIVNVTSDKCYKNKELKRGYKETDELGGYDPYASSKACSELITDTYRNSFFKSMDVNVASVRSGNVIGGGDWSSDRLIPDFFRVLEKKGDIMHVRSPGAIRPWQHVLEPISGYLKLAEYLETSGSFYSQAWNFGPDDNSKSVEWIINFLTKKFPNIKWKADKTNKEHETKILKIDSSKSKLKLGWFPKWDLNETLDKTVHWYEKWKSGYNATELSLEQIEQYEKCKIS